MVSRKMVLMTAAVALAVLVVPGISAQQQDQTQTEQTQPAQQGQTPAEPAQTQPAQTQNNESQPAPEKFTVSKTYDEAIARFPENLRSGFEAINAVLTEMGQTEEKTLQVLHIYLALNHIKVNIIDAGKTDVMLPNQSISYTEFYNKYRAIAIEGFNHLSPAISVMGNPFNTADWDTWYTDLEAFI